MAGVMVIVVGVEGEERMEVMFYGGGEGGGRDVGQGVK